jgi:hypothetical protein
LFFPDAFGLLNKLFRSTEDLFKMFSQAHMAFRQHPWLRQRNNIGQMFPGLGTAIAIYGTYLFGEALYDATLAPDPKTVAQKRKPYGNAFEAGKYVAEMARA